jgi:purine-binding chemotaxis protein CheW
MGALRLVCFELRGQELALPISDVRETLPLQPITPVFLTPPCLAGVFSLRGDIVPAIDLGVLLGFPAAEPGHDARIVVVEHSLGTAGIVVDRLRDLRVLDGELDPPPANLATGIGAMLLGVTATPSGTVRVLDARAIFSAEPLRALGHGKPDAGATQVAKA